MCTDHGDVLVGSEVRGCVAPVRFLCVCFLRAPGNVRYLLGVLEYGLDCQCRIVGGTAVLPGKIVCSLRSLQHLMPAGLARTTIVV